MVAVSKNFASKKQDRYSGDKTVADWWRKFNDAQLNALVERGLKNNHDLRIAEVLGLVADMDIDAVLAQPRHVVVVGEV